MRKLIKWAVGAFLLADLLFAFLVFGAVTGTEIEIKKSEGWKPPKIEQCDKELWERVRNGC